MIAYPAPEEGASFARSIVAAWIEEHRRRIAIRIPMRPEPPPAAVYDAAASALRRELDSGRDVALLCQGDPFFYGSFSTCSTGFQDATGSRSSRASAP